jgi:hypothetical protein
MFYLIAGFWIAYCLIAYVLKRTMTGQKIALFISQLLHIRL